MVLLTPVLENNIISIKTRETEGGSDMAESYDVAVKVVSQKGTCGNGHKVGDEWIIKGKTPEGICLSAFNSLFAVVMSTGDSINYSKYRAKFLEIKRSKNQQK